MTMCHLHAHLQHLYVSLLHNQLGLSFQIGVSRLSHGSCILSTTPRLQPPQDCVRLCKCTVTCNCLLSLSLSLSHTRSLSCVHCLGCVPVCVYVCVCVSCVCVCARACACMDACMHYALQSAAHLKTSSSSDTHCMHHASLFHTLSSSSFMQTEHHIYIHTYMHTYTYMIHICLIPKNLQ